MIEQETCLLTSAVNYIDRVNNTGEDRSVFIVNGEAHLYCARACW